MTDEEVIKKGSPLPFFVLFGLIFLPGAVAAFILWSLFRYRRHRLSVVAGTGTTLMVVAVLLMAIVGPLVGKAFSDLSTFGAHGSSLALLWLAISVFLGAPFGMFFVASEARRIRKNPYLTQLEGSWRHNFEYKNTPLENARKKKNIKKLKNALLVTPNKAPIGLDELTEEVVYRYDTEARKHTAMIGASGAGKALHANTWIPTKRGFVKAARVKVGDILFDEKGKPATVTAKFQPNTPDHYELKLSNGEVVRACGDHLWSVREVAGSLNTITLNTRDLASNPSQYYISSLKNSIEGVDKLRINANLLGAWIASGAGADGFIRKRDAVTRDLVAKHESFVKDLQSNAWLDSAGERIKLDSNLFFTTMDIRERVLESAVSVAGSHTINGETKFSVDDRSAAEFLRQLVFSLGMQPTVLEVTDRLFTFRFKNTHAKLKKRSLFTESIGALSRKGAPLRGTIHFDSIEPIEDNPADYFCFTVDSPSHLFLFGKSFTPTHNTLTMQSLISADIENGKTVVVVDFKRSPKFAAKLAAWSADSGREFYHFMNGEVKDYDIPRSKGQCFYDPLKSGTPTSRADMVLGMREYDSNAAVYKSAMQQLLQVLFNMLNVADHDAARQIDWTHGGINQLASAVTGNGIGELAAACTVELAPDDPRPKWPYMKPGAGGIAGAQEVFMNTSQAKNAIELAEAMRSKGGLTNARDELQGQMRTITASEYGKWMKTGNTAEDREIDLFELTKRDGNVILFSLNSDSEPLFAQFVGSMIFSDLTNISALRRNIGSDNQVNIYVDEFQAVPPTAVTSLLEKSRESKMALTIAQQSFDQIIASADSNGEAYLNSILDTCSNFIAHAGSTEDSATRLSKLLGKRLVTVYSKTNANDSSFLSSNRARNMDSKVAAREEERWVYPPSEFMKLSSPDPANGFKSTAVWVTKTSADPRYAKQGGVTARTVWVIPADKVLVEYYEGKQPEARPVRTLPVTPASEYVREQPVADINFDEEAPSRQPYNASADDYDYELEAEGDDDWGMVEVEDEPEETPVPAPLPITQRRPASRAETAAKDSVADLFRSSTPKAPAPSPVLVQPNKPTPKPTPVATPPKQGLPSAKPGLPLRPGGLPRINPQPKPEGALPDINDMQLPEL